MGFGLGLEIGAYVFRLLIHNNDFDRNLFVTYLYCVTLGPAFLSAAIYLCLARIVIVYGEGNSRLKPHKYSICFVTGDFLALSLQGAGGGMAVVPEVSDIGVRVMIAGLSFQVLSLVVFALVCGDVAWRVRRGKGPLNPSFSDLRCSRKWIGFLIGELLCFIFPLLLLLLFSRFTLRRDGDLGHHPSLPGSCADTHTTNAALAIATTAIIIRSAYRVAELHAGFHSSLGNNEPLLMVLEGGVVTIACLSLTIFHPGLVFRRQWRDANFRFGSVNRRKKREDEACTSST